MLLPGPSLSSRAWVVHLMFHARSALTSKHEPTGCKVGREPHLRGHVRPAVHGAPHAGLLSRNWKVRRKANLTQELNTCLPGVSNRREAL